jgi:hypothetical protein
MENFFLPSPLQNHSLFLFVDSFQVEGKEIYLEKEIVFIDNLFSLLLISRQKFPNDYSTGKICIMYQLRFHNV